MLNGALVEARSVVLSSSGGLRVPFDVDAARDISEVKTRVHVDPTSTIFAFDLHRACSHITNICRSRDDEVHGYHAVAGTFRHLIGV